MNYIVLDFEWNQAPVPALENKEIPFEIIEIGAVRLNEQFEKTGEFSRLIKPRVYKKLHTHTKRIIHLSMSELNKGDYFTHVCRDFLEFIGENPMFCTWGPQDLTEFMRNMDYYKMQPLSKGPMAFLDVQKLYSIAFDEKDSRKSLENAIDDLCIEKDIPFHRAMGDASYTARILQKLPVSVLAYCSFDLYRKPACSNEEIFHIFPDYMKYISRKFLSKTKALEDPEVKSCNCYLCNTPANPQGEWFTPNGKHYINISKCSKHGLMKSKIRLHKAAEDGKMYVVKTQRFITDNELPEIEKLKNKAKYFHELPREKRKNIRMPR